MLLSEMKFKPWMSAGCWDHCRLVTKTNDHLYVFRPVVEIEFDHPNFTAIGNYMILYGFKEGHRASSASKQSFYNVEPLIAQAIVFEYMER